VSLFFSADFHLNHANIIKYCGRTQFMNSEELSIYNKLKNRPQEEQKQFKISKESVIKMNETLIRNCNERVKEDDTLFFVGDLGFKSGSGRGEGEPEKLQQYIEQIKCKNVIYIEGNHDTKGRNSFKTPIQNIVIKHGGKRIFLVHNPDFCNVNYEMNFVGHIHQLWKIKRIRKGFDFTDAVNVGVDMNNFYPITYNEIYSQYQKWLKEQKNDKT